MTKKQLVSLTIRSAPKIIQGLFVLWVGIIAPLIYLDRFATYHLMQPYRFALFERPITLILLPQGEIGTQLVERLTRRFSPSHHSIAPTSPWPNLENAPQWGLGQLYLAAITLALPLLLGRRFNLREYPFAVSADLSPPKKPPRFLAPSI